jgi:hypothetical protein
MTPEPSGEREADAIGHWHSDCPSSPAPEPHATDSDTLQMWDSVFRRSSGTTALSKRDGRCSGTGKQPYNLIHIELSAAAMTHLLTILQPLASLLVVETTC